MTAPMRVLMKVTRSLHKRSLRILHLLVLQRLPLRFQRKKAALMKMMKIGKKALTMRKNKLKLSKKFFEEAGEVVDVRLSTFDDGSFKGSGHVEFATVEAAQKIRSSLQEHFGSCGEITRISIPIMRLV